MNCCLCGRELTRANFFVNMRPVGDVCARRAGLTQRLRSVKASPGEFQRMVRAQQDCQHTGDLFDQESEDGI